MVKNNFIIKRTNSDKWGGLITTNRNFTQTVWMRLATIKLLHIQLLLELKVKQEKTIEINTSIMCYFNKTQKHKKHSLL